MGLPASVLHRPAQTPKEAFSEVKVHGPELRRWISKLTCCRFSTRRFLITMVKETVIIIYKKEFRKIKRKRNLFVSFIDLMVMKTLLTARLWS